MSDTLPTVLESTALNNEVAKTDPTRIAQRINGKAANARQWGLGYMLVTLVVSGLVFWQLITSRSNGGIFRVGDQIKTPDAGSLINQFSAEAIARLGAVAVGIFLIQVFVGIARYYFRMAEHLSACSDAIELTQGDPDKMSRLMSVMNASFDFGKVPTSPIQKVVDGAFDVVKDITKKIPDAKVS